MKSSILRQIRTEAGVPLKAVARDLDVDPGFLSKVERGIVSAPRYIVEAYEERFGVLYKTAAQHDPLVVLENGVTYKVTQYVLPLGEVSIQAPRISLLPRSSATCKVQDAPPVFSLSPNPHMGDIVHPSTPPKFVIEPYSKNISAGKNSYVYDAHTYHTKVPPQGIELLIDYYTRPGDVILDPFCGSGMTGVAAAEKGRKPILCDLSPAATFITYNLTTPIAAPHYLDAIRIILESAKELERKLYETRCRTCGRLTPILYMVWSYGMLCKHCGREFVLWDVARDEGPTVRDSKVKTEFACPYCDRHLKKRELKKTQRYPVLVGYKCCQTGPKEATAQPDEHDLALLDAIEQEGIPQELWYPTDPFPSGINTRQPIAAGITSVDKAYTRRALWAMAYLWDMASRWPDPEVRSKLLFTLTSLYKRVTVFSEFRFWGGSGNTANFNVPAIMNEQNVFKTFERKANTISWYFGNVPRISRELRISTQSACHLTQLPDKSVDYIFTDPPFGGNINYSEMNFLWESWLGIHTDTAEEAIVNRVQGKGIGEYQQLLLQAFSEMRRVLKDESWMTVVFHNSSAKVWNALQKAITEAGFAIEGIQTFDKRHGTFKQFVSDNAVGYNLVLHCRKSFTRKRLQTGDRHTSQKQAMAFIRQAISKAPDKYVVRFQHVLRDAELDYRKLYAEWLASRLPTTVIGLSFEEFRSLVDRVLRELRDPNL